MSDKVDISKVLGQILNRLDKLEEELKKKVSPSNDVMEQALRDIDSARGQKLGSLSTAEQRFMENIKEDVDANRDKGDYTTLRRLRERTGLDYKTVSGYTNLFVGYGILEKDWDQEKRINIYRLIRR